MKRLLLWLLRGYKKCVSPLLGNHCRFVPTCSEYAYEAIERFGVVRGCSLAVWRVVRCNPFNRHYGSDPVPEIRGK